MSQFTHNNISGTPVQPLTPTTPQPAMPPVASGTSQRPMPQDAVSLSTSASAAMASMSLAPTSIGGRPAYNGGGAAVIAQSYGIDPKQYAGIAPDASKDIPVTIYNSPSVKDLICIEVKREDNSSVDENQNIIAMIKGVITAAEPFRGAPRDNVGGRTQISLKGESMNHVAQGGYGYDSTPAVRVRFRSDDDRDNVFKLLGLGAAPKHAEKDMASPSIIFMLPRDGRTNIKSGQTV